jgi:hypothetical protein
VTLARDDCAPGPACTCGAEHPNAYGGFTIERPHAEDCPGKAWADTQDFRVYPVNFVPMMPKPKAKA